MHESFEYTPGAALRPYVERAVGYFHSGLPAGIHVGMPSGSLTLVVPLDEPLTLSRERDGVRTAYASVVAGLDAAPTHIHHLGHQHGIQLALRPDASRALLGCRPADLAGESYEWSDVFGGTATSLRERLHEIPDWPGRLAALEAALVARLTEVCGPRPEVGQAWRLVEASGGRLPVREVARRVGWSVRQLEKQFRAEYGLSPKTVAVVRRFARSVPMVSGGRQRLAHVAAACGYADQAHLARDWRTLAGVAPSRWAVEDVLAVTAGQEDSTGPEASKPPTRQSHSPQTFGPVASEAGTMEWQQGTTLGGSTP